MFLLVIDAYLKWPEVVEMTTGASVVSAARTIEELRRIFHSSWITSPNCVR